MGWRRDHGRPNKRPNQIKAPRKERPGGVFRALGQIGNEKGARSERHLTSMLQEVVDEGKLLAVWETPTDSWADAVMKADLLVRRLDGKVVPIQAKSSFAGVQEFTSKWKAHCDSIFGAFPVWVIVPSADFVGRERDYQKERILDFINSWRGHCKYESWMIEPSPFFRRGQYKKRSFSARVEAFKRAHPKYFTTSTPS